MLKWDKAVEVRLPQAVVCVRCRGNGKACFVILDARHSTLLGLLQKYPHITAGAADIQHACSSGNPRCELVVRGVFVKGGNIFVIACCGILHDGSLYEVKESGEQSALPQQMTETMENALRK